MRRAPGGGRGPEIQRLEAAAYTIPTDAPESDGTPVWAATTVLVVQASASGERGHGPPYFRRTLEAGAVDVLQADATRCAGITGLLRAGALCPAFSTPLSAHTAPALHLHPCCALASVRHLEYCHDHVRVEMLLFGGAVQPKGRCCTPTPRGPAWVSSSSVQTRTDSE